MSRDWRMAYEEKINKWCDAEDKCDARDTMKFHPCTAATKYDTFAVDKKTNQLNFILRKYVCSYEL